ncbi:MAG: hypothetical protein WCF23_09675 [Candidatus Nitrosopolaris sp.]
MSNNVGIDFTELGPPHCNTAQNTASKDQVMKKQDKLITIGFRVKPKERESFKTILIECTTS